MSALPTLDRYGAACRCLLRLREDSGAALLPDGTFIARHLARFPAWQDRPGETDLLALLELARELGLAATAEVYRDYDHVARDFLLHHVGLGARLEHAQRVDRFVVDRQHHDLDARVEGLDVLDEFDAAVPLQRDIHDHDIRQQFRHLAGRRGAVFRLAAQFHIGLRGDHRRKAPAHQGVIIGDVDSSLHEIIPPAAGGTRRAG